MISIKHINTKEIELHLGDTVNRHLMDGDVILFNRQPTLHRMSMMGHRVKVLDYNTFRLNVMVTSPYNADFDGDEMNLHCPQNIQTMSELKDLTAVPYLILTAKDGKPSIEVVQDTLVGAFRLTKDYTTMGDKQMANLQMCNSYFKGQLKKPSKDYTYTGKQLFSEILPPALFIEDKNKDGDKVIINNSTLVSGNLDKAVFHNITNGLIPVIYHDYGPIEIKKFLDNTQRLVCRWLLTAGFSIGISDLVSDKNTDTELVNKIREMKQIAYKKLEEMRKGTLENNSIVNNEQFIEREIISILNQTTNEVAKISLAKIDERTNRMFNMVNSGSKGKPTNIAQIMACVGQQNVDGKRISYGFTDRTLPHFTKYDDGPEARGFVENSFISGLSPQEVFFHAMGGREGLIDTAVKSVSGDTPIIIIEDGICKTVNIGEWIDEKLNNPDNKEYIEQFGKEDANMEMFKLENKVYITTADNSGNTSWGKITTITRHDPEENLYKVITKSGREVIIPNSKTLLIWNKDEKEFIPTKTEDSKIGDYVPTAISFPEPPTIINDIDMSKYFPKDKYIHGYDFNLAIKLYNEEFNKIKDLNKIQFTRGWYDLNNNTNFTLPYENINKFKRGAISGRSTINLKDNGIYPYHAARCHSFIPNKFELNRENGVFIGLFIANGNSKNKQGIISITNEEPSILNFIKNWFEKFDITYRIVVKEIKGKTTSINGNSSLLARFLDEFVGIDSYNKQIPDIAHIAPKEFVIGLLDGYFSGNGSIKSDNGNIYVSSSSKKLIQGI